MSDKNIYTMITSTQVFLLILFIFLVCCMFGTREPFTTTGLAISPEYCGKLVDTYNDPKRKQEICGM